MRIALLGNSGSGKSTLAQQIAKATGAPVLDLDTIVWEPGQVGVARDPALARRDLQHFCAAEPSWIIEGCYGDLISATFLYEPYLLFLDPGVEQCIANCKSRPWEPHKYASHDEQNRMLEFLLTWAKDYYHRSDDMSWAGHASIYQSYQGKKAHLSDASKFAAIALAS